MSSNVQDQIGGQNHDVLWKGPDHGIYVLNMLTQMRFELQGNDLFNKGVRTSSDDLSLPDHATGSAEDPDADFKASLATHLIYFAWCDEGWRQFIDGVEEAVRDILQHAREARIDDDLGRIGRPELATTPESIQRSDSTSLNAMKFPKAASKSLVPPFSAWSWTYLQSSRTGLLRARGRQTMTDPEKAQGLSRRHV